MDARDLFPAFQRLCEFPDVTFPAGEIPVPEADECHRGLADLLEEGLRLMPRSEHADGWDDLQRLLRRLNFLRQVHDWNDLARFMTVLEEVRTRKITQKRWSDTKEGKAAVKAYAERWNVFVDARVGPTRQRWQEYRYAPVMGFLAPAARAFALEREASGRLSFTDLLICSARMLKQSARARGELGRRYRHLLVDEFQDTDPVQAEVCLLLASDPEEGTDWREVTPRPGAVFVVGDPKQSIYRFRRADIETYEFVRGRMERVGAVLRLTRNFRSTSPIEALVNGYAAEVFPAEASRYQAPFAPMQAVSEEGPGDGVFRYTVSWARGKAEMLADDAGRIASWIAGEIEAGRRTAATSWCWSRRNAISRRSRPHWRSATWR